MNLPLPTIVIVVQKIMNYDNKARDENWERHGAIFPAVLTFSFDSQPKHLNIQQ